MENVSFFFFLQLIQGFNLYQQGGCRTLQLSPLKSITGKFTGGYNLAMPSLWNRRNECLATRA